MDACTSWLMVYMQPNRKPSQSERTQAERSGVKGSLSLSTIQPTAEVNYLAPLPCPRGNTAISMRSRGVRRLHVQGPWGAQMGAAMCRGWMTPSSLEKHFLTANAAPGELDLPLAVQCFCGSLAASPLLRMTCCLRALLAGDRGRGCAPALLPTAFARGKHRLRSEQRHCNLSRRSLKLAQLTLFHCGYLLCRPAIGRPGALRTQLGCAYSLLQVPAADVMRPSRGKESKRIR